MTETDEEAHYRWMPATAAQQAALDSEADILLFGGSAGSLKTETMLMDAVQEHENPNLRAIIFRSSFVEMTDLLDKTRRLYGALGGVFVGSPKWTWSFPSGATIRFAYMKTDDDVWKYLGPRYSFIGFDESTLHTERQVRNILGRLSSTDSSLRLRMRLTSNPGNVGAAWHQTLFLRGHCPVHNARDAAQPGQLYRDRCWPSDGEAIPFSVAFIPGKLSDHNLLDANYSKRLHMMSGGAAAAMEQGCWCTLEGAYFPFMHAGMVRPLAEVGVEWWHNHFLSIDYGYGKSSSSVGLYVRGPAEVRQSTTIPGIESKRLQQEDGPEFPQGRIRKIGELVVPHVPAYELAQMVVDAFIKHRRKTGSGGASWLPILTLPTSKRSATATPLPTRSTKSLSRGISSASARRTTGWAAGSYSTACCARASSRSPTYARAASRPCARACMTMPGRETFAR